MAVRAQVTDGIPYFVADVACHLHKKNGRMEEQCSRDSLHENDLDQGRSETIQGDGACIVELGLRVPASSRGATLWVMHDGINVIGVDDPSAAGGFGGAWVAQPNMLVTKAEHMAELMAENALKGSSSGGGRIGRCVDEETAACSGVTREEGDGKVGSFACLTDVKCDFRIV